MHCALADQMRRRTPGDNVGFNKPDLYRCSIGQRLKRSQTVKYPDAWQRCENTKSNWLSSALITTPSFNRQELTSLILRPFIGRNAPGEKSKRESSELKVTKPAQKSLRSLGRNQRRDGLVPGLAQFFSARKYQSQRTVRSVGYREQTIGQADA